MKIFALSNFETRQKAYLDSGASIHVTGDAKHLSNKRPSALQIQGYTNATWAQATAAGEWGPLKNVQCITGAQNLVSSGSFLDDIHHSNKAGIYSTTTDAYLLSGFNIHEMPAGSTATRITTAREWVLTSCTRRISTCSRKPFTSTTTCKRNTGKCRRTQSYAPYPTMTTHSSTKS